MGTRRFTVGSLTALVICGSGLVALAQADAPAPQIPTCDKKIGTLAREEMETLFGRKIFLELFVKVRKDWRDNPEFLNAVDWRAMRGRESD